MHPRISELFATRFGHAPVSVEEMRAHGSDRRLYRLRDNSGHSAIGVENSDLGENAAFISFSRHFRSLRLPMPEIYADDRTHGVYLEEDLGDTTLFDFLQRERGQSADVPPAVAAVYEEAVRLLPVIQIKAARGLDYSLCYPRSAFDRRSMMWDLNYFKYYFLKLAQVPFHEQQLENDFDSLCAFLFEAGQSHFLYRDFQSRNIMVRDGKPWFIDYQGGRRGAIHYDLASLLLDAKANLPFAFRDHLKQVYLAAAKPLTDIDPVQFELFFRGFSLIRLLQAMGAYGFRGFYERKAHFLQSVPYAIRNLEHLLQQGDLPVALPALSEALQQIVRSTRLREIAQVPLTLTVSVESFSYKNGYPHDDSGHGGGFVFDCRALPNPGREARFAALTGLDAPVADWLRGHDEIARFVTQTLLLLEPVVAAYQKRNFTRLAVSYGCTGGRHRSVYCAEELARQLRTRGGVVVEVRHREQPAWAAKA
jgi:aminoglycoside/choline kinase family phosphotransferase